MAIRVPVIAHLRVLSVLTDLRDELPSCSKYAPKEQGASDSLSSSSFPSSSLQGLGFSTSLPTAANLAQLEVLLQNSPVLGWFWTGHLRLQVVLRSCVLVDVLFAGHNGIDIEEVIVNQSIAAAVKPKSKIAVCCALCENVVVVSFTTTELLTFRRQVQKKEQAVCSFKKRSRKHSNCDSNMIFNPAGDKLLLSFSPAKTAIGRPWFPRRSPEDRWVVQLYSCDANSNVPLKRQHQYEGKGNGKLLGMQFLQGEPLEFLLLERKQHREHEVTVLRFVVEDDSVRLLASVSVEILGAILSAVMHPVTGAVAVGLEDFSLVVFNTGSNYCVNRKVCDIRPEFLKWSDDGIFLSVFNSEGSMELFDAALLPVPCLLLSEHLSTEDSTEGLRLRPCFNSITPLTKCAWVSLTPTGGAFFGTFTSACLLQFERGPLALLCFQSDGLRSQADVITKYRCERQNFSEAFLFVRQLDCNRFVTDITSCIRSIMTETLKHYPFPSNDVCDFIEAGLVVLKTGYDHATCQERSKYHRTWMVLNRRYFGYLLSNSLHERALRFAKKLKTAEFLQRLQNTAYHEQKPDLYSSTQKELLELFAPNPGKQLRQEFGDMGLENKDSLIGSDQRNGISFWSDLGIV